MTVLGTFAGGSLDSIAELFGLYGMEIMSDPTRVGWTIEGLVGAGMAFVGVIIMLIQLYVSLADTASSTALQTNCLLGEGSFHSIKRFEVIEANSKLSQTLFEGGFLFLKSFDEEVHTTSFSV